MDQEKEIVEMQKKLEERKALTKQTDLTPIGLELGKAEQIVCPTCGSPAEKKRLLEREFIICQACVDKEDAETREKEAAERKRWQEAETFKRFKDSGIGEKFIGATFDDYIPPTPEAVEVLRICREYAQSFDKSSGRSILMIGSCGTGKNMLASIIGQEIMKAGKGSFRYTTAMRIAREVKDSWKDKTTTEKSVMDSFKQPSLLCIDEVGVQFGSPTEQIYITEVINDRYEDKKPTILIANLTVPQLENIVGVRVIDRFYEKGNHTLVFKWPSYRRR